MLPVRPVPGATSLGKSVVLPRLANCFAIRAGRPWPACGNRPIALTDLNCAWERLWPGKCAMATRAGTTVPPYPYMLFFLEGGSGGEPFSFGFKRKRFPPSLPSYSSFFHTGPRGVSVMVMPCWASWSRRWSALAKSPAWRAVSRCSTICFIRGSEGAWLKSMTAMT